LLWLVALGLVGVCCWWLTQHIRRIHFPNRGQQIEQR
jgi:hypothetical protein